MENISKISKIFLFLGAVFFSVFFGAIVGRTFLEYNLFHGIHFELNGFVNAQNLSGITQSFAPIIVVTVISFVLYNIFFIGFVSTSGLSLKNNGWLFISTVLLIAVLPIEGFLIVKYDKPYIDMALWGNVNGQYLLDNIIARFKAFSSFPVVEALICVIVTYFFAFQPLKKKNEA
ncbi:MAG: hypothetical protein LWX56_02990 [Ignavibacteria bacterium]|nr:hypothetical protein [Ignavibacteria bacterium]